MDKEQFDAMEFFIADFFEEISKRKKEADADMKKDGSDLFVSGRALAYNEILEILQNRLDVYGIEVKR